MKIRMNQQLIGVDKKPIVKPGNPPMTLKDICIGSILTPIEGDDEKKKFEKYEIFKKIRDAKAETELKAEEIVVIKKAIGKFQPPLIMGQCFEMLEN